MVVDGASSNVAEALIVPETIRLLRLRPGLLPRIESPRARLGWDP